MINLLAVEEPSTCYEKEPFVNISGDVRVKIIQPEFSLNLKTALEMIQALSIANFRVTAYSEVCLACYPIVPITMFLYFIDEARYDKSGHLIFKEEHFPQIVYNGRRNNLRSLSKEKRQEVLKEEILKILHTKDGEKVKTRYIKAKDFKDAKKLLNSLKEYSYAFENPNDYFNGPIIPNIKDCCPERFCDNAISLFMSDELSFEEQFFLRSFILLISKTSYAVSCETFNFIALNFPTDNDAKAKFLKFTLIPKFYKDEEIKSIVEFLQPNILNHIKETLKNVVIMGL